MSVTKQHYIEHLGIKILRSTHPDVRKIKRLQSGHSAHGNKVWRSSFALIDYLETYPFKEASKVLEIGCGWGLAGLYLTKNQKTKVTGIDIDPSVKPYFELQNKINHCSQAFEARGFESFDEKQLQSFDYLIGTDICFWDELTTPLFELIKQARAANIEKILISDPGRSPFWALAERCVNQLNAEVITRRIDSPWKSEKYILVINAI